MLAFCFVIVYFSLPIVQTVRISGGFILASDKISPFYFIFIPQPYLFRFIKSKLSVISILGAAAGANRSYFLRLIDLFSLIKYGFNHLKKTFRDLDIKKSQGSFLSHSNIKAIVRYHLKDLITACNLPAIKSGIFINMLIPVFCLSGISILTIGKNYANFRYQNVRNVSPLLVYTMRLN